MSETGARALLEAEALEFTRELIRIDSVNTGEAATIGDGETRAASLIRDRLREVGLEGELIEPRAGRGSFVVRIPGRDPGAGALLAHAHVDVVPADERDWSHPPFGAEIHDGYLYGRGAVDMKNFAGTLLAVARHFARTGVVPRRDLVLAFLADEEHGGVWGARWLVEHRPELFIGVTEAVSEVGGFSVPIGADDGDERRAYLVATSEKGVAWATLTARAEAGHGSRPTADNPVVRVANAVARIGAHRFPVARPAALERLLEELGAARGSVLDNLDDGRLEAALAELGFVGALIGAGLRSTATPTVLASGGKVNVIPARAEAKLDIRLLPGDDDEVRETLHRLAGPGVELREGRWWSATEAPADGPLVRVLGRAIGAEDPGGTVLPYLLPASTDNKHFARLGISGYGFVPLRVPRDFDVFGQFHAADERVPVEALRFCARVTARMLAEA